MKNDRTIKELDERIRTLNDLALKCAKKHLSSQTGLIHYFHNATEEEAHQTIPLYENFLYCYALMKTKAVENINEAKQILFHLLFFQNLQGCFPIYLHEYPISNDRTLGIKLLFVMSLIYKQFAHVLGGELYSALRNSCCRLLDFFTLYLNSLEKPVPQLKQYTLGALMHSFGSLFDQKEYQTRGESLLQNYSLDDSPTSWFAPSVRGTVLSLMQLPNFSIPPKQLTNFWTFIQNSYDPTTGTYGGPSIETFYDESNPEVTLIDYYYAAITGIFPAHLEKNQISQLEACLIQPQQKIFAISHQITDGCHTDWGYFRNQLYSLNYLNGNLDKEDPNWKGFIPFRVSWGDLEQVQSLLTQGGNYQTIKTTCYNQDFLVEYKLSELFDLENKDLKKEISLYLSRHPDTEILINDQKATTFKFKDTVIILSKQLRISLNFSVLEGEGEFMGHLVPANRPSQNSLRIKNKLEAYDWQIFIRTLRRSKSCTLQLKAKIFKN